MRLLTQPMCICD